MTPVAVMGKPFACPGECVYCPTFPDVPKSYTPQSPAVLRAIACDYEARRQVKERLRIFSSMGHPTDKVELIIMGGTFLAFPSDYQYQFIKDCYDALNGFASSNLEDAKVANEIAEHRCVGLCIETRPDWCQEEQVKMMLEFGTTRVELGVQTLDDDVFMRNKRGHKVSDVIRATGLLKGYGLKVYYHWMPGLPGSCFSRDLEVAGQLFASSDFRPDGVKIYPTLVVAGTELEKWYTEGRYQPYSDDEMADLVINIKTLIPKYVRIPRVMRDIPPQFIIAGCRDLALRSALKKRMVEMGVRCNCIRCREYGHRLRDGWRAGKPQLKRIDYEASDGKEVFLSYEDENETLFGLLRLRVGGLAERLSNHSMVRELHIYGSEVPIGEKQDDAVQHRGLGRELLEVAERISHDEFKVDKIAVISGVGVRDYFRNECGYKLEDFYMVKKLA